jgi:hypothetical protein
MAKIEMDIDTKLPPERVVAALTDFSDRRPDIWPILSREFYEVYSVGETSADVREGQTKPFKVSAEEHYDWSTPGKVVSTVKEATFMKAGSSVTTTAAPAEGGGSHVHIVWERFPTSPKGWVAVAMMKATGGKPLTSYWKKVFDGLAEKQA